jgi:ABC-type amino acid transport substrate-binding protein
MGRILVLLTVVAGALSLATDPVQACGDKLMMLGRGIKFQSKHTPRAATVLLYLPESATGQALTDPKLESALREAGHTVRAVTSFADLQTALRAGTFDVVLANVTHAPELEKASAAVGSAVVLPAIYLVAPASGAANKQQSKADRDKSSKEFGVIVEVPGRPGHYCHAVDQAMELKLKREKQASRQP